MSSVGGADSIFIPGFFSTSKAVESSSTLLNGTSTTAPATPNPSTTLTPHSSATAISNVVSGSLTVYETITVPTTVDGRATSVGVVVTTVIPNTSTAFIPPHKHSRAHVVAGIVTSMVILAVLLLLLLFYYRKRKLSRKDGVNGGNDSLENVYLSSNKSHNVGSRREVDPPTTTVQRNAVGVVTPFETGLSAPLTPATPASSTDISHGLPTLSESQSPLTVASVPINTNERSSEKGSIGPPSIAQSPNNILSPLPPALALDEKRAPTPYVLQWDPSTPSTLPPTPNTGASSSPPSPSPPPRPERSLSFLLSNNRPTSTIAPSIAPSEVAPAYYPAPHSASRSHFRHRSGASVLTNATESVPPAYDQYEYDAARAPPVPPLPPLPASAVTSGSGSRRSLPSIPP